jgi:peptidoglycan hydrolase CwlO-like protein
MKQGLKSLLICFCIAFVIVYYYNLNDIYVHIDTLDTRLSQQGEQITALQSRISTLDRRIAVLERNQADITSIRQDWEKTQQDISSWAVPIEQWMEYQQELYMKEHGEAGK